MRLVLLRLALRSVWLGGDSVGGPAVVWYRGWWRGCEVVASYSSRMGRGCMLGGFWPFSYVYTGGVWPGAEQQGELCSSGGGGVAGFGTLPLSRLGVGKNRPSGGSGSRAPPAPLFCSGCSDVLIFEVFAGIGVRPNTIFSVTGFNLTSCRSLQWDDTHRPSQLRRIYGTYRSCILIVEGVHYSGQEVSSYLYYPTLRLISPHQPWTSPQICLSFLSRLSLQESTLSLI